MLTKWLVKFCVTTIFALMATANVTFAAIDFSARPSLSAVEHFAAATQIASLVQAEEEPLSTEAAMAAVFHVEQAIAKGYSDRKQSRVLLREMLWAWGASKLDCYGKYKDSKDTAIQKLCTAVVAANERANNMTPELYRDYPDDPKIVSSYLIWVSAAGAENAEKEVILKKGLSRSSDRQLISELAYVLLDEGKFKEAKERFIEALDAISDDYVLADKIQKYSRVLAHGRCAMPSEIETLIQSIPARYKSEFDMREQKVDERAKSTKEELEDSNKIVSIKKQVINAIHKAKCNQ